MDLAQRGELTSQRIALLDRTRQVRLEALNTRRDAHLQADKMRQTREQANLSRVRLLDCCCF